MIGKKEDRRPGHPWETDSFMRKLDYLIKALAEYTGIVADDIPANIGVVVDMLSCESIEVLIATGGEEALELIANHPPDLVLLDVRMPGHRRL
jgi:PleD family two-component response regulator